MRVEFFGVPRQRAGISQLEVKAETLGQMLQKLAVELPSLREFIKYDRLESSFAASLNGERFVDDPQTRLTQDDSVIILSADAGG